MTPDATFTLSFALVMMLAAAPTAGQTGGAAAHTPRKRGASDTVDASVQSDGRQEGEGASTAAPSDERGEPSANGESRAGEKTEEAGASGEGSDSDRPEYFRSKAISVNRSREPVDYARPLSEFGLEAAEDIDWLLFGIEHRTRFEIRDDNYRADLSEDEPFVLRSRMFLGVREVLDPFRFGIEFQDSRAFNTRFPDNTSNVNENDILQAYGELYFEDVFGKGLPLRLQAGRMAVDYVDRRLRTRNGFRNTTNAFDGFRVHAGAPDADWELDAFAVQPVVIRPRQSDHPDEERWFWGFTGTWRGWHEYITLEPYYFVLDGILHDGEVVHGELHSLGLHAFGPVAGTRFDYDIDVAFQVGHEEGGLSRRAFATHAELGYTLDAAWKPRLAAWANYATGDAIPGDRVSQRFDPLFGSSTGYFGYNEFFQWQNVINPAFGLRLKPGKDTELSAVYRAFWLASDQDVWNRADRQALEGHAGSFIGQSIDVVLSHDFSEQVSLETGYAHFFADTFARNTGDSPDSDMFFVQVVLRL